MAKLSVRVQNLSDDREELLQAVPDRRLGEDEDPRRWSTQRLKRFIALVKYAENKGLI